MKVLDSISRFDGKGCVLTLGTFDGVHLGHRMLLRRCRELADEKQQPSVVLTFDRHPLSLVCPERAPAMLATNEERAERMAEEGMDVVIFEPFTREFAAMSPEEYVLQINEALHPSVIVVGRNHSFGKGGKGSWETLTELGKRLGFAVEAWEPLQIDGGVVSSTRIRSLLSENRMEEANRLLGK